MTKKKKILNGVIFLVGLIVFAVYYFKDNTDLEKVEKTQDDSAKKAAKFMEEDLNASFDDGEQIESDKKVAAENPETGLGAIDADLRDFESDKKEEQVTICECENIFWDYSEKKDNAKTEEERTQLSREESVKNIKCYELEKSLGAKLEDERAKCK